MKQGRLNFTVLLSKYEDMLDALDLNSVAKVKQINLQFIITAHIKNLAIISFLLLRTFCATV